jgi:hypothetical protein
LICDSRTRQSKNSYEFSGHRNTEFFNRIGRKRMLEVAVSDHPERPLLRKADSLLRKSKQEHVIHCDESRPTPERHYSSQFISPLTLSRLGTNAIHLCN